MLPDSSSQTNLTFVAAQHVASIREDFHSATF
jgi:hypothetical protein